MRRRTILLAAVTVLSLLVAACGNDGTPADELPPGNSPSAEEPAQEPAPPEDPDASWDDAAIEEARQQARGLLGMNEADLPDDVRIARRGDEQFMLTQDYVLGRRTVELDDTDGSGYRVVAVTVELPGEPETFELQGG